MSMSGPAGDAVDNDDHSMVFVPWTKPHVEAELYEEPGCSSHAPHARATVTAVTISGMKIHLASNGMTFWAIRRDHIQKPPKSTKKPEPAGCGRRQEEEDEDAEQEATRQQEEEEILDQEEILH
jgi:hypothetical protein